MYSNEINESEFFEENDLYIDGNVFKANLSKIDSNFTKLSELFEQNLNEETKAECMNNISVNEIKISNLEDQIEESIKKTTSDIIKNKKKQLFVLDKSKDENNPTEPKKGNYLRNEAKVLEEKIKSIQLPEYSEIKKEKYKNCELSSYHFFKNFCKKEVGKENNYIFNYRDNYLNDMTKIDQLFFKDYFKPNPVPPELSHLLVYEFSIYHPTKNIKTQQISVLGDGTLSDLKDKIYCVLDEILTNSKRAFFFIENIFFYRIPLRIIYFILCVIPDSQIFKRRNGNFYKTGFFTVRNFKQISSKRIFCIFYDIFYRKRWSVRICHKIIVVF